MNENSKDKTHLIEKFFSVLEYFFESLSSLSEVNIKRIMRRYSLTDSPIDLLNITKPYYFKEYEILKKTKPEQIKLVTFLLNYYNNRNIKPPSIMPEPDNELFDDTDAYMSRVAKVMNYLFKDVKILYGTDFRTGEIDEKSFYDRSLKKGEKLNIDDLDTIEVIIKSYIRAFEYIVPKLLGKDLDQYVDEIKKGLHPNLKNHKVVKKRLKGIRARYKDIIKFFKVVWKNTPVEKYLKYLIPDIRNAYQHESWDPDFGSQNIIFKDEDGNELFRIPFFEFAAIYHSNVQTLYVTLGMEMRIIEGGIMVDSNLIKQLKEGIKTEEGELLYNYIPNVKLLFPEFALFASIYNSFVKVKREEQTYDELFEEISEFLLEGITVEVINQYMALLVRYIVSDYPFVKPEDFKNKILQKYIGWVKLKLVKDDLELISKITD